MWYVWPFLIILQGTAAASVLLHLFVFSSLSLITLYMPPTQFNIFVQFYFSLSNSGVTHKVCSALALFRNNSISNDLGGLFPVSLLLSGFALLLFDEMVQWKQRHVVHPDFSVSLLVCEIESFVLFCSKTQFYHHELRFYKHKSVRVQ